MVFITQIRKLRRGCYAVAHVKHAAKPNGSHAEGVHRLIDLLGGFGFQANPIGVRHGFFDRNDELIEGVELIFFCGVDEVDILFGDVASMSEGVVIARLTAFAFFGFFWHGLTPIE